MSRVARADRSFARGAAWLAVAAGVLVLLFVGWELWGTNLASAQAQVEASATLDGQWATPPQPGQPAQGEPIARIAIPRLGPDWSRVVLEGATPDVIDRGPGHYPGTALPGQVGNFAIAGHRVGSGAPFDLADTLRPCDPIAVETRTAVLTYRVLPTPDEPAECNLPAVGVPGRTVVSPQDVQTIAPHGPIPLLTITTCHPRYSARQRLIVHAVLTSTTPKA